MLQKNLKLMLRLQHKVQIDRWGTGNPFLYIVLQFNNIYSWPCIPGGGVV